MHELYEPYCCILNGASDICVAECRSIIYNAVYHSYLNNIIMLLVKFDEKYSIYANYQYANELIIVNNTTVTMETGHFPLYA